MPKDFYYQIYTGQRIPSGELYGVFNRGGVKGLTDTELALLKVEIEKEIESRREPPLTKPSKETIEMLAVLTRNVGKQRSQQK